MYGPAIKLYPDKESGAWNWELLLRGKTLARGESSSEEAAYAAARQALAQERERRSER
jgi:dsRNA-specific ribonuclease